MKKLRGSDEKVPGTDEELNHMINTIRRSKILFNFGQHYSTCDNFEFSKNLLTMLIGFISCDNSEFLEFWI